MKNMFRRRRSREEGWLAIAMQPAALHFAHAVRSSTGRCRITRCGTRSIEDPSKDIDRIAKELEFGRYRCLTLLASNEYQLLLVEAPNVPPAELKTAVRWRVKDMLDYHVEDATIDVLDIPPDRSGAKRNHSMYAVAARNDAIQRCIGRFEAARIPLTVIDIGETAQRNVAELFESPDRGLAFLYLGASHASLTINYRGELFLARRIDVSVEQLLEDSADIQDEARNRILLELQRSFDHFDRQFPYIGVAKLLLGPEPADTGLAGYLSQNLDLPVDQAHLVDVLDIAPQVAFDADTAWRLFPVVGAALRSEAKAL
jgi:MSHA biogenesis protein MshI